MRTAHKQQCAGVNAILSEEKQKKINTVQMFMQAVTHQR